jgi:hypothetical protein
MPESRGYTGGSKKGWTVFFFPDPAGPWSIVGDGPNPVARRFDSETSAFDYLQMCGLSRDAAFSVLAAARKDGSATFDRVKRQTPTVGPIRPRT